MLTRPLLTIAGKRVVNNDTQNIYIQCPVCQAINNNLTTLNDSYSLYCCDNCHSSSIVSVTDKIAENYVDFSTAVPTFIFSTFYQVKCYFITRYCMGEYLKYQTPLVLSFEALSELVNSSFSAETRHKYQVVDRAENTPPNFNISYISNGHHISNPIFPLFVEIMDENFKLTQLECR